MTPEPEWFTATDREYSSMNEIERLSLRLETVGNLAELLAQAIRRGIANKTVLADDADRIAFIARNEPTKPKTLWS